MTDNTSTRDAIAMIASKLGVSPNEIKAENPRWLSLLQEGVIVRLHISRWRATTSLDFGDLGLPINGGDGQDVYKKLVSLGNKYLMPKEIIKEMNSIDSSARQALERLSFKTYWGAFVPATAYPEAQKVLAEYQAKYLAAIDKWLEQYGELVIETLDHYADMARIAYRRAHKLQAGQDRDYRYLPEDEYVDHVVRRIASLIPPKDEVRQKCSFEIELAYIPLPSILARDVETTTQIQINMAKQEAELQMHADVLAQARAKAQEQLENFLKDFTGQLWALAYEASTDVLKTVGKNGYLHPRSVKQLKGTVSRLRSLNFTENAEIECFIAQMEQIINTPRKTRQPEEVIEVMRSIGIVARQTLVALGEPAARKASGLGVPDMPAPTLVAEARKRIGLSPVQVQAEALTSGGKKL